MLEFFFCRALNGRIGIVERTSHKWIQRILFQHEMEKCLSADFH